MIKSEQEQQERFAVRENKMIRKGLPISMEKFWRYIDRAYQQVLEFWRQPNRGFWKTVELFPQT